jgi:hypothetical protein
MDTRSAITDLLKDFSEERLQEILNFTQGVTINTDRV